MCVLAFGAEIILPSSTRAIILFRGTEHSLVKRILSNNDIMLPNAQVISGDSQLE